MRLSVYQHQIIKSKFLEIFEQGKIYLFGSRVDNSKKGGDIDLYIVTPDQENLFMKKVKFLAKVKRELGEQKIDVVFHKDYNRLIEKEALKWGIQL